jgi:hypothetical protein
MGEEIRSRRMLDHLQMGGWMRVTSRVSASKVVRGSTVSRFRTVRDETHSHNGVQEDGHRDVIPDEVPVHRQHFGDPELEGIRASRSRSGFAPQFLD